jgi:hypothetical protein
MELERVKIDSSNVSRKRDTLRIILQRGNDRSLHDVPES